MNIFKWTAAAAALALIVTSANALDLQAGGEPKLKTTQIQLGIIPPADNLCPGQAKFQAWVFTNKPGEVPILIVAQNGHVSGPYMIETIKGENGLSMGTYTKDLNVALPINTAYKIVTPHSDVASNWVPLQASC